MARHQVLKSESISKRNEMGVSNTTIRNAVQIPPSSGTVVTPSVRPEGRAKNPLWKALTPVALAVVLALLPVTSGLAPYSWYSFSIFVAGIVGLVLEPLPGAAIALMVRKDDNRSGRFPLLCPRLLQEA